MEVTDRPIELLANVLARKEVPKTFEDFGLKILFPDSWTSEKDTESNAVTIESPEGAFLSIARIGNEGDEPLREAKATMEEEYEEIEEEVFHRSFEGHEFNGLTQRFVYLDLIVTSHLAIVEKDGQRYLIQMQAEDNDMNKLQTVFDAMLTSMCQ